MRISKVETVFDVYQLRFEFLYWRTGDNVTIYIEANNNDNGSFSEDVCSSAELLALAPDFVKVDHQNNSWTIPAFTVGFFINRIQEWDPQEVFAALKKNEKEEEWDR